MAARWTNKEDEFLKEIYPCNLKEDIIKKLNKPWDTIHRRAIRLKLRRDPEFINKDRKKRKTRKDAWSPEEEQLLKSIFENNTKEFILSKIKRPWAGIYRRAKKLNLTRNPEIIKQEMIEGGKSAPTKEKLWTGYEDKILKENYGNKRKKEIMNLLPGRSWTAVRGRAIKLQVTRDKDLSKLDNIENSQKAMLKKYGVKSGFSLPKTKEKIKKALKKRYGVDYPMQAESIKSKCRESVKKKFGVDNVFQANDIKKKSKKTNIKKYGTEYPTRSSSVREKTIQTVKRNNSFGTSDEEVSLFFILKQIDSGVQHQVMHPLLRHTIDFYLPSFNLWLQYDGSYWHRKNQRSTEGPRAKRIAETIERDNLQNKTIPNLVRVDSDELKKAENKLHFVNEKIKKHAAFDTRCHQYLMKLHLINDDKKRLPFDTGALKASQFNIQHENFSKEITKFIEQYEWLGAVGNTPKWCYTARYQRLLAGVVLINEPNAYSLLLGKKTPSYEALIQRGATASWTPKNLGSRLIMFACRHMVAHTNKRLFVCYADPKAREIGTIYQACNFDYLGDSFGAGFVYHNPEINDGFPFSAQTLKRTSAFRKWCRTSGIPLNPSWIKSNGFKNLRTIPESIKNAWYKDIEETLERCIKTPIEKKHKYALLLFKNKREQREITPLKRYKTYPYPKRAKESLSPHTSSVPFQIAFKKIKKKTHPAISTEDCQVLKKLYPLKNRKDLAAYLNKSEAWVRYHVNKLIASGELLPKYEVGGTKSRKSRQKTDFLKKHYHEMTHEMLAEHLGESKRWVKRQISTLLREGILKSKKSTTSKT